MAKNKISVEVEKVTKNPYTDPKDPRHKAVEIRREYERQGYEVVHGSNGGVFDPKTGKRVV